MNALDRARQIHPKGRAEWRAWLEKNHATSRGVWLVSWKPSTGKARLDYDGSIEEALCFGWVDGQSASIDDQRSKLYFAPRRERSPWARTNKRRFARMLEAGLVEPAGMAAVARAKANGSWSVLDSVERLEVPAALAAALEANPPAQRNWDAFPPSVKRQYLTQIALAQRDETKAKRVAQITRAAKRNERPA